MDEVPTKSSSSEKTKKNFLLLVASLSSSSVLSSSLESWWLAEESVALSRSSWEWRGCLLDDVTLFEKLLLKDFTQLQFKRVTELV